MCILHIFHVLPLRLFVLITKVLANILFNFRQGENYVIEYTENLSKSELGEIFFCDVNTCALKSRCSIKNNQYKSHLNQETKILPSDSIVSLVGFYHFFFMQLPRHIMVLILIYKNISLFFSSCNIK